MLTTPTTILANVIVAIPLALVAFVIALSGQSLVDSGYRGSSYSFQSYRPKPIKKLTEVPSIVVARMKAHLIERLGKDFFSQLKFDWGEDVNLEELYKIEPYWKTRKVATYNLLFHFSKKSKGLKAFYCRIGLGENGQVLEEINLPDIVAHPRKGKIINLNRALEAARNSGFETSSTPEFGYDDAVDSFVWIFHDGRPKLTEKLCSENLFVAIGQGPIGRIYIEAHTGKVLRTNCYRIVV